MAELDESALGDADHAVAAYEKMLELDPADLRAHRALDRHYAARERWRDLETLLGTRVGFASDAEVAELEFRRAELRASHLDDVDGALELLEDIVGARPATKGRGACSSGCSRPPSTASGSRRSSSPIYEASARLGAPGRDPRGRSARRRGAGPRRLLARIADLQENRLQARARRARDLAAGAGGRSQQRRRARPRSSGSATALERFSELVDVYQELAFKRDAADIERPRRSARRGRPSCTRGGSATGAPRSTSGSWSSALDPNDAETAGARGGGARDALHRDRRRRRRW